MLCCAVADLKAFEAINPNRAKVLSETQRWDEDGTTASCVVITGRADVHGLFDLLLNTTGLISKRTEDVPVLYAPAVFEGATLRSARVVKSAIVKRSGAGGGGGDAIAAAAANGVGSTAHDVYSIELAGAILPPSVVNLCRLLQRSQSGEFRMRCWTDPTTSNLNAVPHTHVPALGGMRGLNTTALSALREFDSVFYSSGSGYDGAIQQRSTPAVTRIKCSGKTYYVAVGL